MIIIYGPTGVGKTDFVYRLARHMPIEIINMDIGAFYTPLTIGTAKPDLNNVTIPHHLFNIFDSPAHFTIAQYRDKAAHIIAQCRKNGTIPVFVGGSGFYAKALLYTMSAQPAVVPDLKDELITWKHLRDIDPERAAAIHPNDIYRISKALELCYAGFKASDFAPRFDPIDLPLAMICLLRDRADLYQRIDDRVKQMLDHGWIDEVKSIKGTSWEAFIEEKKIIGYEDVLRYLDHIINYQQMVDAIAQKTKNYAKRQITLWNGLQRNILKLDSKQIMMDAINLTFADLDLYIEQLLSSLHRLYE